jgi:hypothetical protein
MKTQQKLVFGRVHVGDGLKAFVVQTMSTPANMPLMPKEHVSETQNAL